MRFDVNLIRTQIENLLTAEPELGEDEVLRADMIEGETDAHEFLRALERERREAAMLAESIEATVAELQARKDRFERRMLAMRSLMLRVMESAGANKIVLPEATLTVRNNAARCIITNESEIPREFMKVTETPRKQEIRDALARGETVPGAVLSNPEPSLMIRTG